MAEPFIVPGDMIVRGILRPTGIQYPAGGVGDGQFNGADPLTAAKQEHQHVRTVSQNGAAVAETRVAHHAHAAGTVVAVEVGCVVPAVSPDTCTVDVKKNGTTILSGVVTLNSGNAAYAAVLATITVPAYAAGDTLTVVVTPNHSSGTLPSGVFASLVLREAAD